MVRTPWNRNRTRPDSPQVPAEVEEYYQSTQKERRGVAWLLAFATLLLTLIIAVALFFGGRWLYRTVFGNNDKEGAETVQQEGTSPVEQLPADTQDQTSTNGSATNDQNGTDSSGAASSSTNDASQSPSSTQSDTNATNGGSTTTPTTGPSDSEIPNTGPGDHLY